MGRERDRREGRETAESWIRLQIQVFLFAGSLWNMQRMSLLSLSRSFSCSPSPSSHPFSLPYFCPSLPHFSLVLPPSSLSLCFPPLSSLSLFPSSLSFSLPIHSLSLTVSLFPLSLSLSPLSTAVKDQEHCDTHTHSLTHTRTHAHTHPHSHKHTHSNTRKHLICLTRLAWEERGKGSWWFFFFLFFSFGFSFFILFSVLILSWGGIWRMAEAASPPLHPFTNPQLYVYPWLNGASLHCEGV